MEGREVANPSVLGQRQHLDGLLPVEAAVAVPEIVGERELPVDDGRHEPPAPALRQRPGRQEGSHGFAPLEPARSRRHREYGVVGEHGEDGVDVPVLPGLHVTVHEAPEALVPERPQRRLLAPLGQPLVHRPVCALENAVDGVGRRVERLTDLRGGEAEDVAKDQHRPLPRRQVLERRDKRQLDALALLVARVGRGKPAVGFVGRIGVRLQPGRFGERRRRGRREDRRPPRSRPAARAWSGAGSASGRRSSRSGRARSGASFCPRTGAALARRAGACPGVRPRHPGLSRASGSSARGALGGGARRSPGRRPRRPGGRIRSVRVRER